MSGSKLGQYKKLKENRINPFQTVYLSSSYWKFVRITVLMISKTNLIIGHVRLKAKSLDQIEGKSFQFEHIETLAECLSWWYLCQVRMWLILDKKNRYLGKIQWKSGGRNLYISMLKLSQKFCFVDI